MPDSRATCLNSYASLTFLHEDCQRTLSLFLLGEPILRFHVCLVTWQRAQVRA